MYAGCRIIEANRLTDYPDVVCLNAGEMYRRLARATRSWCFVSKGRTFVQTFPLPCVEIVACSRIFVRYILPDLWNTLYLPLEE